jgi:subtilisin
VRKRVAVLSALLLVLGLTGGASAGIQSPADGGYRIVLQASDARGTGIAVRHGLERGRASAQVTDAQLALLKRRGIAYELVPVRHVSAKPTKPGGGGGGLRILPATQTPYGLKMVYGDPDLTVSGVGGGSGLTVAVLDTGSIDHVDFTRADGTKVITGCVDFSHNKSNQIEGKCSDGHGHGTHVTGTVAAAGGQDGKGIFGVAPNASIYSYKVLTDRGSGYADDVARAIRVAADRGANIVSMSLGSSTPSSDELDAIRYANSKGVLVIAAAGNSGPEANTIAYPGGFAEVVGVASLNPDEVVSYFSSRGLTDGDDTSIVDREVEVAGPGRSVLSTYKDGAYATMSGTSMATPHIAGLAAKMWQGGASATRDWLRQSAAAHDITQAEQINNAGVGYDIASGYGLPQVVTKSQSLWSD